MSTALYGRLSKEDHEQGDSVSIETQRKLLREFAAARHLLVYDEYFDDGYSGTTFDRPQFQRLLQDIEAGHIAVVITKDLSRLGRNSAETSHLIDEYFPRKRVRYIAISDQVDTATRQGVDTVAPFANFINEFYARDASRKIRDAIAVKQRNGEFIGNFAPFGYAKDPCNKNHLIIDPPAAAVVADIFSQALQGFRPPEIAQNLQSRHIPPPAVYRQMLYPHLAADTAGRREWTANSIRRILKNQYYIGDTVQHKTTKSSFKSKGSIPNARQDWVIVPHTHTPIIDRENWNHVQRLIGQRTCAKTGQFQNLFAGLAVCADCGKGMSSVGSRKKSGTGIALCCGNYKRFGPAACSNHFIDYDALYQIVLQAIQQQATLSPADQQALLHQFAHQSAQTANLQKTNQLSLKKSLAQIEKKLLLLLDDKYSSRIAPHQFAQLFQKYQQEKALVEQQLSNCSPISMPSMPHAKEILEISVLSRPLLCRLIDKIEISQGEYETTKTGRCKKQAVSIHFRFQTKETQMHITF